MISIQMHIKQIQSILFLISATDEDPIRTILGDIDSKLATGWDESKKACIADGNCKGIASSFRLLTCYICF